MKALSLTQPWATAVASGSKQWETRSWPTLVRGQVAIHAAKTFPRWARQFAVECGYFPAKLPLGAILCVCTLTDCRRTEQVRLEIDENELNYGDYDDGRWAFKLENVRQLEEPIICRGALGSWAIAEDMEQAICSAILT